MQRWLIFPNWKIYKFVVKKKHHFYFYFIEPEVK